ncbi:hypothetical protein Agabi119p4_3014 [Agaricus bisporus var. burnettii]|uniref:Actin cytoskeleton organization protein n=1 Tax=Agaricus bisporus var. burnettii TaxID=192524 RepID=A0A8H7F6E1_AGABI|nr:hypothetical protein Agabi119p4_3014 [Agaricus bisporus var. burnettii]
MSAAAVALDRQIRPVYDALDTGSNKSAIVTCNKLLKKYPRHELIKALKALALVRSQKIEESLVLCEEVLDLKPTSDATLTAMMHVLRGLGRHKDMVKMFEEAYKQQPHNEELGIQNFFANVRASQWKSAQLVATRMHKQFQDDRYLYWTVISTVLQAEEHGTPLQLRELLYKLAHRLVVSSPTPSYVNSERFHLHLSILLKLDLIDDAHKLLDSPVGRNICATNLSCNELRREVWKLKGLIQEEGGSAKGLILDKDDRNWLEFLSVLDATFADLADKETDPSEEALDVTRARIRDTEQLFLKVVEKDGLRDRTGLLSLLELEKRSRAHGLSSDENRLITLLQEYLEKFSHKPSCHQDLLSYTQLEGDELQKWKTILDSFSLSFSTEDELARVINLLKLQRHNLLPSEITHDAETARAALYTEKYLQGLKFGATLPSTELQPADDLALLAATSYVSLWKLTTDDGYLYSAVALLEYALTKSKQSYSAKLMLVRLYRLLGAPAQALEHYRALRVKQVQNETLSYFILSRTSMFSSAAIGDLTFASECLEANQIYLNNSQETGDFIIRAFSAEKYSQIPEFVTFEDRLENSLQRDLIKIEHLRMRLAHENIISDIVDLELIELKFIFDRVHHDNRDTNVLPNYQPRSSPDFNAQTLLFDIYEGHGFLRTFLKLYIRCLQQGSDLDDTVEEKLLIGDRPKKRPDVPGDLSLRDRLCERSEEDLKELTQDEVSLVEFAGALGDWLEKYHDYARPHPSAVLAEASKQTELKTGHPLKGLEIPVSNGNGHKKDEEVPAFVEPPELIVRYFDEMKTKFNELKDASSPVEALHVAAIVQEAFLILVVESLRFKNQTVVKQNKLGNLAASIKSIRTNAIANLKEISTGLIKRSESECTAESRKAFVEECSMVIDAGIDHDFVLGVAKKGLDARKKVLEGFGKGIARICTNYTTN